MIHWNGRRSDELGWNALFGFYLKRHHNAQLGAVLLPRRKAQDVETLPNFHLGQPAQHVEKLVDHRRNTRDQPASVQDFHLCNWGLIPRIGNRKPHFIPVFFSVFVLFVQVPVSLFRDPSDTFKLGVSVQWMPISEVCLVLYPEQISLFISIPISQPIRMDHA